MSWDRYKDQYLDLILSFHQAEFITLIARATLENFPHNLPDHLKEDLDDYWKVIEYMMGVVVNDNKKLKGELNDREIEKIIPLNVNRDKVKLNPIFDPLIKMMMINATKRNDLLNMNYQKYFYQQQIVMFITYTESFIGDTIRAICRAKPQIIYSSKKQVSWETALSFPEKDELLDFLIEEFISDTVRSKDICEVISSIIKKYGIDININPGNLSALSLSEQVRHIIIHSGGCVDAKFLKKTGNSTVSFGEPFPVDEKLIKNTSLACKNVTQAIFEAVSKKIFDISNPLCIIGIKFRKNVQ